MVSRSAYQVRSSWRETRRLRSSCHCRSAQASRAPCSSASSLGGGQRRLSTPAGRAPLPLPPRSLPARESHRREQPAGSMKAAAARPDLPPPESPVLSGLADRPLPAGLPSPEPGAPVPPPALRPRPRRSGPRPRRSGPRPGAPAPASAPQPRAATPARQGAGRGARRGSSGGARTHIWFG